MLFEVVAVAVVVDVVAVDSVSQDDEPDLGSQFLLVHVDDPDWISRSVPDPISSKPKPNRELAFRVVQVILDLRHKNDVINFPSKTSNWTKVRSNG
jgi:hypothetical protein